jgi:hypothetical protein
LPRFNEFAQGIDEGMQEFDVSWIGDVIFMLGVTILFLLGRKVMFRIHEDEFTVGAAVVVAANYLGKNAALKPHSGQFMDPL